MFELRVLSGLHCGAALPLSGECWLIGSSEEADLQLDDESLASASSWLRYSDDVWWLMESEEATEGEMLSVEQPFQLGDVWLCVAMADSDWQEAPAQAVSEAPAESEPQEAAPGKVTPAQSAAVQPEDAAQTNAGAAAQAPVAAPRSRLIPRWMQAMAFSLLLLLSFTVVSWILQPTQAQQSGPDERRARWGKPADLVAPLQKMLRERELGNVVQVKSEGNQLVLDGALTKAQLSVFNRMMTRFYAEYGASAPVSADVRPLVKDLPFGIVQVTTGLRANIVTDDGQRLFIGDEVNDLRLVSITNEQIEFAGRDPITVKW